MGIMDRLFGGVQSQQQAQPQPGQQQPQQQQQQPTNPHVTNNPTVPNGTNTAPAGQNPDGTQASTPVDQFATLWQTDPNSPAPSANAPLIPVDQQKLAQAVQGMDFTKSVPQELFQQALAGTADSPKALMQIINATAQQAVAQALVGSSQVSEMAIKKHGATLRSEIPSLIKDHSVMDQRRQLNPALSNPAFEPVVRAAEQQMRLKYPNATPTEITQQVSAYLDAFAGAAVEPKRKKEQEEQQQAAPKEPDWGDFLVEKGHDIANW